MCSSLSFTN